MANKSGRKPALRASAPSRVPQQVRIIGGMWKRTPLVVADAEGLRPTPDRVRETVFNWLTHLLDGHWEGATCLDLFAGTGAMGFEAASRGAAKVTLVEAQSAALRQMQVTKEKLQAQRVEIMGGDASSIANSLIKNQDARFDVIFLDPPYHQKWLATMLPLCTSLLKTQGVVYAESEFSLEGETAPDWMAQWEILRAGRAGMVYYHILQRKQFQA